MIRYYAAWKVGGEWHEFATALDPERDDENLDAERCRLMVLSFHEGYEAFAAYDGETSVTWGASTVRPMMGKLLLGGTEENKLETMMKYLDKDSKLNKGMSYIDQLRMKSSLARLNQLATYYRESK